MKRISALLLAILLVMTQSLAMAGATEASGKLVVGNPTQMQGYFFTELWGHSTSDIDVRMLLEGYNLVNWDGNAGFCSCSIRTWSSGSTSTRQRMAIRSSR